MTTHEAMVSCSNQIRHELDNLRGFAGMALPDDRANHLWSIVSECERLAEMAKTELGR